MNIEEIQEVIDILSLDLNFKIPKIHEQTLLQVRRTYNEAISEILNFNLKGHLVPRVLVQYEDEKSIYKKVDHPKFLSYDTRLLVFACALLIDRKRNPNTPEETRWVYMINPILLGNTNFNNHVTEVGFLCDQMGLTEPGMIDRHSRLIVAMFSPMAFHGVVNVVTSSYNFADGYLIHSFTFDKVIDVLYYDNNQKPVNIDDTRSNVNYATTHWIERVLLLTLWNNYFHTVKDINSITVLNRNTDMKLNIKQLIRDHINIFDWSPVWCSEFYTLILYDISTNKTNNQFYYKKVQDKIYVLFQYSDWPIVTLIGTISNQDYCMWSITIEENLHKFDPTGSTTFYITYMSCFLSHIVYKKKYGIKSLKHITMKNRRTPKVFKMFMERELLYQDSIAPNTFPILDIQIINTSGLRSLYTIYTVRDS